MPPVPPSSRPPSRRGSPQLRLRVGFVVIAMVLSAFGARLVQLQALDPDHYAALAAKEGTISVVLPAERGDILDRNGEPLAVSVKAQMVVANPQETGGKKAPQLARYLSRKLGVDYFSTLQKLRVPQDQDGSSFQYVARRVPASLATSTVDHADELGYDGLSTRTDPLRTYPGHDIAANVLGFVGTDKALGGLENTFDKDLSGTDGHERYEVGGQGNQIPLGKTSRVPAVNGQTLHLTLDRDLTWYTQRVLSQAVRGARGDSGIAVVMDTKTGDVLSLADYPTFDADDPGAAADKDDLGARSLSLPYEPGSVEKVLTLSSLIDAGKVNDRTRLVVPHELDRNGSVIHDYFEHGDLKLTLAGVLAKSSNIGTVLASDRFNQGQLRGYLDKFGLGQRTDIGLAGETPGILPDPSMWTSGTEDRIDFGQSLSVNAMQMAAAVNTIANGGVRIDPSLIKGVATEDDGTKVGTGVATSHRVVSKEAARQTTLMMERTVDPEDGVAPAAQVPGYIVAGKTGTAQRVGPAGTYDGTFTVSFAGFAPAQKPRFSIYVVVQNPRNGGGGGSVAGPVFSKLMAYTLQRYGVPPSKKPQVDLPVTW